MKRFRSFQASLFISLFLWGNLAAGLLPAKAATPAKLPAVAAKPQTSNPVGIIQQIEESLFATRFDDETVENRLNRLETTVLGQAQTGQTVDQRVTRLKTLLAAQLSVPGKLTSANTSSQSGVRPTLPASPQGGYQQTQPQVSSQNPTQASTIQASMGGTDYPVVTLMERKLFNRSYENEDITLRLNRVEGKVFQGPQGGSLADRVDQLRSVVLGDNGQGEDSPLAGVNEDGSVSNPRSASSIVAPSTAAMNQPYAAPPQQWSPPAGGFQNGGGYQAAYPQASGNGVPTPDLLSSMSEVEKEVLGHTYQGEPLQARLDRVETKVFNATSPEMSSEQRIQRIVAVASAGGAPESPKAKARSTLQSILPIILTILPMVLL